MDLRRTCYRLSKIVIFSALMLLAPMPSVAGRSRPVNTEEPHQGDVLSRFSLVPGSLTLVGERHVLALFKDKEDDLYAVVLFSLNCAADSCDVGEVIAYSLFDSRGVEKQLAKASQLDIPQTLRAPRGFNHAQLAAAPLLLPGQ